MTLVGEQARNESEAATAHAQADAAPPVLLVFIEPAPYVVSFVAAARRVWPAEVDILYIDATATQNWAYRPGERDFVLPRGRLKAFLAIKRRIDSRRYGLVHLAGWGHPLLYMTLLYANGRIPVSVETDTPAPHAESTWKRLIKPVLYRRLFQIPGVFTPAGTAQSLYLQSFGVPPSRIRIAQQTADIEPIFVFSARFTSEQRRSARARLGLSDDQIAILYAGRLETVKGVDDLLAAFDLASRQAPNLRLLIAGDGTLKAKVLQFAQARDDVIHLGRLSSEALNETSNIADFLVLPSRSESWGMVVNEAMAAGLPVVVSERAGCIPDLVHHRVTGFVAPAQNPGALSDALLEVAGDRALRMRMRDAAKQLISAWTIENEARNVTEAWRHALVCDGAA